MAGTSVLKLKVDDKEYNSSLKQAQQGMQHLEQALKDAGKSFKQVDKSVVDYVRGIGQMEAQSKTARGRISEMSNAFVELSVKYNKMSDDVKKSDVGKALAASMEELKQRTIDAKNELEDLNRSLNEVKLPDMKEAGGGGLFAGLGNKMSGAIQVFAGNMLTKAAGAVASFGAEMYGMVQQGVELAKQGEGIRIAFERLGRGDILDGLRKATHGTVTDLELMKAAVKFNDFKLPLDELGTMLAFAQQKAKDTGQSVDYMVESITNGLGRQSKPILDNLGISAKEIEERMKSTGDFTKAVGEIIREQMAKTGDYVETAADRATQADVKLKNAMEDLGRTFQPLSDAGTSLWSDLKIGALDLLNNAVRPLIDALTEAGRIRSQYQEQGGDSRVNRQLERLRGINTMQYRRNTYNAQLSNYDSKIGSYEQYLSDYKKWQGDKTAVGAYDRMQAFQKQTGLSVYSDVKEQLEVFKKMRSEYVMGAKSIIADNPAPSPATPTDGKKGGSGKNTTPTAPTYAADSIAAQQALVSELTKQWNEAGAEVRNSYIQPLVEAEAKLKTMKDEQALLKEQAQGRLLEDKAIEIPITANVSDSIVQSIDDIREKLKSNPIVIPIESSTKDVKALQDTAKTTAKVVGTIGQAFNAIEDPAAKVASVVAQAIANVAFAYSDALAKTTAEKFNIWSFIAAAAASTVSMVSTIASIHSATGYAQGGMIKGNSYSGDNIGGLVDGSQLVGLNAGEIVLNAAGQSNVAANLRGGAMSGMRLMTKVKGTELLVWIDNSLAQAGRGELVTWGT